MTNLSELFFGLYALAMAYFLIDIDWKHRFDQAIALKF
jgi:hypothetical protein